MNKQLLSFAATALTLAAAPALAYTVVRPDEAMLYVAPYGRSRISTVTFCLSEVGVTNRADVVTDSQVEGFDRCMRDQT
jgi:hypothetical protein